MEEDRLEVECIRVLAGASEVRTKVLSGIALGEASVEEAAYLVKCRVKDQASLLHKVKNKRAGEKPDYSAREVRDIVGLRLLTLFRRDLPRLLTRFLTFIDAGLRSDLSLFVGQDIRDAVEEIIIYTARKEEDEIDNRLLDVFQSRGLKVSYSEETDPKDELVVKVRRKKSQYSSIHIVIWCENVVSNRRKHKIPMEVQIRTSLEDVWGEIEHKLGYKNEDLGNDAASQSHIGSAREHLGILKGQLDLCTDSADVIRKQMEYATPSKLKFTASVSAPSVNMGTLVKLPIPEDQLIIVNEVADKLKAAFEGFANSDEQTQGADLINLEADFQACARRLKSLISTVDDDSSVTGAAKETSLYYLKMEAALSFYWAGRCATSRVNDPSSAEAADQHFINAIQIYNELARDEPNRHDAILAYRIANVLTAQGHSELALGKLKEAVRELAEYEQRDLAADHFLRVRIPRQLGVAHWEMAERLKEEASSVGLDDMFQDQRQDYYLEALQTTLPLLDLKVAEREGSPHIGAEEEADETMKTTNNVIEYALCFARSGGSWAVLERNGVSKSDLTELVESLTKEASPDDLEIPVWGDTLRAANEELLSDDVMAKAYARRTREILLKNKSGFVAIHGERSVEEMLNDASATLGRT